MQFQWAKELSSKNILARRDYMQRQTPRKTASNEADHLKLRSPLGMTPNERIKRHTTLRVRESGALGFLRRASAKRIHLFRLIPPFADLIDRLRQR